MNKEQLLNELSNKINTGEINHDEVVNLSKINAIKSELPLKNSTAITSSSVTKLLYVLGAIIVIVGVILFTYQIWYYIGSFGRILITLGMGLVITGGGSLLHKSNKESDVGKIFHFIGGMLIPGGALVTLMEFSTGQPPEWPLAITFGLIFAFYLIINSIHKSVILTFFTIANGTAFIYLLVEAITKGMLNSYYNLYAYLTIIIGMSYMFLAYSFKNGWNDKLVRILNLFGVFGIQIAVYIQYINIYSYGYRHSVWPLVLSLGTIFFLYLSLNTRLKDTRLTLLAILNGSALLYSILSATLGSYLGPETHIYVYLTMVIGAVYLLLSYSFKDTWNAVLIKPLNLLGIIGLLGSAFSEIFGSLPWQIFFLILVIFSFALSIYVRSLIILIASTVSLLAFASYITNEYFANSIGWPVSLVILGFLFISLGYFSITINKKYIK